MLHLKRGKRKWVSSVLYHPFLMTFSTYTYALVRCYLHLIGASGTAQRHMFREGDAQRPTSWAHSATIRHTCQRAEMDVRFLFAAAFSC